jgi:hypothetical protein
MSEMVERVARAMRAQEHDADEWDSIDSSDRYYWRTAASTAIEAMRAPLSISNRAVIALTGVLGDGVIRLNAEEAATIVNSLRLHGLKIVDAAD